MSGSRPSNTGASVSRKLSTIDSIGSSRKCAPSASASLRASCRVPSELNREGMETQWTRPGPSASQASAAVNAESMPPETLTTTSPKPFFSV